MKYTPLKYKDVLALFDNTSKLEVIDECMYTEKIIHKPTGWYFYTTTSNFISCFFNKVTGSEVDCPLFSTIYADLFTKPANKIQKAVYEAKNSK